MQVHQGLVELNSSTKTVVTIGAFDGVHRAHKKILRQVHDTAALLGLESAVITFWPHPRMVLSPNSSQLQLLTTPEQKFKHIEATGIHHLYIIPFTLEFSNWTAQHFVEEILINRLKTSKLILGYDHHFGKNREGNLDFLIAHRPAFGFEVEAIEEQTIKDATVSSTQIRHALYDGNIGRANELLGYAYSFSGEVVIGDQLGRTIGFPTANLAISAHFKLIPANGVYTVRTTIEGNIHFGVMNIGTRPTLHGSDRRIEVHIFNFETNIYGITIEVEVLARIRDEQKFDSLDTLKVQIARDKEQALQLIRSREI